MHLQVFLALSLSVLTSGELQRIIQFKEGKACVTGNAPDVFLKLGKKNQRPGRCKEKCSLDEKCEAVQYIAPRSCKLWYSTIDQMGPGQPGTFCGRVKTKIAEDAALTNPPTASPISTKDFVINPYTKCATINLNRAKVLTQYTSRQECQQRCNKMPKCKSFQWNGKRNSCILIKYKVTSEPVKQEGEDRVCGYLPKTIVSASPTKAPTKAITKAPTKAPTKASTKAPINATIMCTLKATLAFPFDTPNDAPYHGYNSEYMEVTEGGNSDDMCSYLFSDILPTWCTYENSDPDGDSAYVVNLDDNYYDDKDILTSETIEIFNAAGRTFNFAVSHYFFEADYYPDEWKDHAMATVLKINNESHESQNALSADGWSHPVDIDTPTHIKNQNDEWEVNPDYQGDFIVTVACDDNCLCSTSYTLL